MTRYMSVQLSMMCPTNKLIGTGVINHYVLVFKRMIEQGGPHHQSKTSHKVSALKEV